MASREGVNFNAACFRGRSKALMSVGMNLDTKSAAVPPPNSQPILRRDEGMEGEGLVARKLERRGLWNIDLNAAPPEVADCEFTEEEGVGSGSGTLPPPPPDVAPDDSAKKADSSDERELNFCADMRTAEINAGGEAKMVEKGGERRWLALLGVAENALREKKEEEIRKRKRGASQEAELGGETAATPKRIGGQRRQSLAEDWAGAVAAEAVVARSTRGRAVAMPSKYKDSVLGAVAVAAADLPRHHKSGKSATVFCTKRKSR